VIVVLIATGCAGAGRIRGARESLNGGPNVAAVLARRDEVIGVDEHTGEPDDAFLMPWVQSHRIALVRGRGRLTGERRVTVGDEELEARKAVLLSGGSEPLLPPIDGLEDVEGVWTNREALTTREIDFDVYDTETSASLGGLIYPPDAQGTARFLVHRGRRVLIGCTITGSEVADFLHAATIAVVGEVPLERLRHAVPPFPTRSELWLSLLEQAGV
jgi:pyruvate/2-oxoglutarate dehydrogenase complex dihydrolipoamide dehydrogenase (E3) component